MTWVSGDGSENNETATPAIASVATTSVVRIGIGSPGAPRMSPAATMKNPTPMSAPTHVQKSVVPAFAQDMTTR
ncbi:hypothetical protein [Gordonia paraffinivorans]|uniref:hypothetical protein n=1 Tax=Gordonia paraffinivorans TaxID=175628 RepID=UPI00058F3DCF|nr:hypothetical protein [Gordonia paraffinivorans]